MILTRPAIALLGAAALWLMPVSGTAHVPHPAPALKPGLFVNLASGDSWRGWMALHFAHQTLKLGHPVTVFLNLDGVRLAAPKIPQERRRTMHRTPVELVGDLIRDGAVVLYCGPCLAELDLVPQDLVPGLRPGALGLTQGLLFADNVRVVSW